MNEALPVPDLRGVSPSLVRLTHVIYLLHAFAVVVGVTSSAATVAGGFVFGLPSLLAVILNYIKRGAVRGTWLDSHFSWQIRTFWYALAWALLVGLVSLPLTLVIVGFATWALGLAVLGIWAVYRVARGWMRLNSGQAMPAV